MTPTHDPFDARISRLSERRIGILVDESAPAPHAVLFAPAHDVTTDEVNEILSLSSGVLFVALLPTRASALMLDPMYRNATAAPVAASAPYSAFVSVEARVGVTTGISAADRAETVRMLGAEPPNPRALVSPGHIFPVRVTEGGVLVKNALPEGAVDIITRAFQRDAALYSDLLSAEGDFLRMAGIEEMAARHGLPLFTLNELTAYRLEHETLISRVAEAKLPTRFAGEMRSIIYRSPIFDGEHLALIKGDISPDSTTLTRVQSEFTFADVFGGGTPPTRRQIEGSLKAIGEHGSGVLIYLRRSSRGQLSEQVKAWRPKFEERSAVSMREFGLGAQILRDLGVRKVELLTGSPKKMQGIRSFGVEIVAQRAIPGV